MHNSRNFWDTYASDFDAIYGTKNTIINSLINKFFWQAIKMRFEKTLQNIPDSKISVIDNGDIDQPRLKFPILKCIRHYKFF